MPEIEPGADLAALISDHAELADGDIVVVTSKIVSKAEGCTVELATVTPSAFATEWATKWDKDPRLVEVVLRESARIVRQVGDLLITETRHGFVCANSRRRPVVEWRRRAGAGAAVRSRRIGAPPACRAQPATGRSVAVIVTDTFGRPWREGQTDVAIGVAGIKPIRSYVGQRDPHGHEFRVQEICVIDEIASAAELVKGNLSRVPVAIVRGYAWEPDDDASMASVIRDASRDLFR